MLQSSGGGDGVHARELKVEGRQSQQTTGHTHIVSIAGEGRSNDQHNSCTQQGIAAKAKIWFQAHGDLDLIQDAHHRIIENIMKWKKKERSQDERSTVVIIEIDVMAICKIEHRWQRIRSS